MNLHNFFHAINPLHQFVVKTINTHNMLQSREITNNTEKDILQTPHLKENPYTLPNGYFASVEDAVHEKIHKTSRQTGTVWDFLKTSIALASVFGIIFGLGYGAMYLTDTLDISESQTNQIVAETDLSFDEMLIETIGNHPIIETPEEIDNYPNISDTPVIDKEQIEQYLIDSNVPLSALASLE